MILNFSFHIPAIFYFILQNTFLTKFFVKILLNSLTKNFFFDARRGTSTSETMHEF